MDGHSHMVRTSRCLRERRGGFFHALGVSQMAPKITS